MTVVREDALPEKVTSLELPLGAELIHVEYYGDALRLFSVVCVEEAATEERVFVVLATGEDFGLDPANLAHVGTVVLNGGASALHVFEFVDQSDEPAPEPESRHLN